MELLIKTWKAKENFAGNSAHNILGLLDIFTKFSFHHKWNEAWLLVINKVYASCLTICRTTSDLGFQQITKYQENLKASWKL